MRSIRGSDRTSHRASCLAQQAGPQLHREEAGQELQTVGVVSVQGQGRASVNGW